MANATPTPEPHDNVSDLSAALLTTVTGNATWAAMSWFAQRRAFEQTMWNLRVQSQNQSNLPA